MKITRKSKFAPSTGSNLGIALLAALLGWSTAATPVRAADFEMETLEGAGIEHRGVWLVNAEARAFVALEPWPRLLRYLPRPGAEPMLKLGERPHDTGIRTWFMEDDQQTRHAYRPAAQPAAIIERSDRSILIRSRWTAEAGYETAVMMRIELLDDGRLRIRHGVQNLADRPRRLAPWSITAFPVGGVIDMVFHRPQVRTVALFGDTTPDDLAKAMREDRLRIETEIMQTPDRALKFGILGKSGEISYRDQAETWSSSVPYSEVGQYPDGGANLTAFISNRRPDGGWSEIEQVGVEQLLGPFESAWLEETISRSRDRIAAP